MVAVAENLSPSEFQLGYTKGDASYEYWRGQAIPKAMPTWLHGLLQAILCQLLNEAGYAAASEVELRIVPDSRLKPDVIATKGDIEDPYPTKALDLIAEILSPDDSMTFVVEKCRAYQKWGFPGIYVIDPVNRLIFRWTGAALEISDSLTSIPSAIIWERLDLATKKR